ncbi:hypothetical protein [Shewanella sp. Actino-trap-3]|nr:hypothetical protein [Shewanella sp. Actino-trap-3]
MITDIARQLANGEVDFAIDVTRTVNFLLAHKTFCPIPFVC